MAATAVQVTPLHIAGEEVTSGETVPGSERPPRSDALDLTA